jgi:guanylate kinase
MVAVSATTRPARPDEHDGVDYHFLSDAEFERRVQAGEFLEHVTYAGNRYGTLRSEVEQNLAAGRSVVVEIELQGARAIRRMLPDAVSVFIAPPSLAELRDRLNRRATEDDDGIEQRMAAGRMELEAMEEFDHRIVNRDVRSAVEELASVVDAETRVGAPAS